MSLSRRFGPVVLVLLAMLAALPASAAVAVDGSPKVSVDAVTTPTDAGCCCEEDPECGSPAEPCAPDGDCCAACVACSLRVVPPSEGVDPNRTSGDEPDPSGMDRPTAAGPGGGIWHPPRG